MCDKVKEYLKEVTSILEDNEIELNINSWDSRGKKKIIKIPSSGHLRYDRFKQSLKDNNFISSMLEVLYNNINSNISSSLINLCHYIAEFYEEEYISATSDSALTFSNSMSAIETASMINDVGIIYLDCASYSKYCDIRLERNYLNLNPRWLIYVVKYLLHNLWI